MTWPGGECRRVWITNVCRATVVATCNDNKTARQTMQTDKQMARILGRKFENVSIRHNISARRCGNSARECDWRYAKKIVFYYIYCFCLRTFYLDAD